MKSSAQKYALWGMFIPVVFWLTLAVCGELLGEYSHLYYLVSELGATGTETRGLFAFGLLVCSALSLVFVVGLFRACRNAGLSVLPVLLILSFTFSIAGAAIFPMPQPLHGQFSRPFALVLLSPLLAMVMWRRSPVVKGLWAFSIVSMLFMLAGALVFVPSVLEEYFGLKQRFMHAGWSIWFAYLSVVFSGILARVRAVQVDGGVNHVGSGSA